MNENQNIKLQNVLIPHYFSDIICFDVQVCVAFIVLVRNVGTICLFCFFSIIFDLYTFEIYMEYTLMSYFVSRISNLWIFIFIYYLDLFSRMMLAMLDKQFLFNSFGCFLLHFLPMISFTDHFVIVYTFVNCCSVILI